jgi:hypothetical protein
MRDKLTWFARPEAEGPRTETADRTEFLTEGSEGNEVELELRKSKANARNPTRCDSATARREEARIPNSKLETGNEKFRKSNTESDLQGDGVAARAQEIECRRFHRRF